MNIQKKLISINFSTAANQRLGICIHTMVGTLAGTDAYFRNPTTQASSHYGVDLTADTVYQWVEEKHQAWAQGRTSGPTNQLVLEKGGNPSSYFISIECADGRNPAGADRELQTRVVAELVADIAKRNNIPLDNKHICGHREIYNKKSCPGNLDVNKIISLAKAFNGSPTPPPMDDKEATMRLRAKSAADNILIDLKDRKLKNKEGNIYVVDAASEVYLFDTNDKEKFIGLLKVIVRDYDLLSKDVAVFDQKIQDKDKVISTQSQQLLSLRDEVTSLTVRAEIAEVDAAKKEELRAKYYEQVKHLEGSLKTSNDNAAYWQRKYNASKPIEKYSKKELVVELFKRFGS